MKIAIGSDHAGLSLKLAVKEHLEKQGYQLDDKGTHDSQSCNYPVYARAVGQAVQNGEADFGILICGTGIGMSMAANKMKGIRAAAVADCFTAQATRQHNNANILCMGERTMGPGLACRIADIFLNTQFEGGRHQTRVDMVMALEEE